MQKLMPSILKALETKIVSNFCKNQYQIEKLLLYLYNKINESTMTAKEIREELDSIMAEVVNFQTIPGTAFAAWYERQVSY